MRSRDMLVKAGARTRGRAAPPFARWLVATVVLAGCGGLEPVAPYSPITDPTAMFMSLTLDHGAVNLSTAAPYDELQLTATPRDAAGTPMAGLPAPTFWSSDTTAVWVTPEGLVQARGSGTEVLVVAELVADGNVRHADTARVSVTTDPAPQMLDALSIEPAGDAGAVWSMTALQGFYGEILFLFSTGRSFAPAYTLNALDASGSPISGLAIEYEALDPDTATINPVYGVVTLVQPGQARIVARTTAYGVSLADTATFTVALPIINGAFIGSPFTGGPTALQPTSLTVRAGGYVTWPNLTSDSVSIVFDDPSAASAIEEFCTAFAGAFCESGDIANYMSEDPNAFFDRTRGRQFREPGTYEYRVEPLGLTGRVVVTDALP